MITRHPLPSAITGPKTKLLQRSSAEDEYHSLLHSLPWPAAGPEVIRLETVGFTSCVSGEGVSTFAAQTALAASAIEGHEVLIIDSNLYRPTVHKTFELSGKTGLAQVLSDEVNFSEVIETTRFRNLYAMPAGNVERDVAALFGAAERLHDLVETLRERFDLVIVDAPPVGDSSIPMPLLSQLDGVVMVVEFGRVEGAMAQQAARG